MKEPNAPPRYGEALLNVAEELNAVDEILEGTRVIRDVVRDEPRLLRFLGMPQVPTAEKKAFVRRVFEGRVPQTLVNFGCLLVDRQRTDDVLPIFDAFELAWDRRRQVHPAQVRTAVPMPEDLKPLLVQELERLSGERVRVKYVVDRSLIGGVVVMFDDSGTDIDGTVRRKLNALKETLLEVPIY